MYDLDLYQQPLPRHYESDEEAISESEGHDHKRSATLDSIMSVPSEPAVERPVSHLLSPFPTKPSRPVSMDTVKRSSSATFVTEPCTIFDHDDEMILELPSPDSTTPLQSPIFLQPSVYVPSPRTSFSSSSSYSDDDSDIFVAEQVTYVEHAKPNIVLISPTSSQDQDSPALSPLSNSSGSVYSNDGAAKSQPLLGEISMDRGRRYYHSKAQGSLSALDTLKQTTRPANEPMSAPAVEVPRPLSFRTRSMSFSRPQTPVTGTDRRRLQKEPPRRPPSAQSTATFSLFPTTTTTQPDDSRSHFAASSTYSLSSTPSTSRTASPNPNCYNRSRSGSLYSVSSLSTTATGKRPPMPYRGSMIKSSTMGGYSSSSLRNESVDGASGAVDRHARAQSQSQTDDLESKTRRMKSMKQPSPRSGKNESVSSPSSSAKSFVGFMLRGKRKSVLKHNS